MHLGWVALSVLPFMLCPEGEQHSLALDAGGSVWAWGSNSSGQCGSGGQRQRTAVLACVIGPRLGGLKQHGCTSVAEAGKGQREAACSHWQQLGPAIHGMVKQVWLVLS